jgi:hypothetical protein
VAACDEGSYTALGDTVEEEVVDVALEEAIEEEPADAPDPLPDHPRIWLTDARLELLRDRQEASTPAAVAIRSWCADHGEDDLDLFVDELGTGMLGAVNYALLYQIQGAPAYAQRAVEIVEHALAHPPAGHSADDWIEGGDWWAARNLVPAVALVLDWTWDWLPESRRDRLADRLVSWCARMTEAEPPGWRDPSTHRFHAYTWALLASGYALLGHHPDAEAILAQARDVMLEAGIAYAEGREVPWEVYGNTTGRADGGMWNEGTAYGNLSSEFLFSSMLAARAAGDAAYADFTFASEYVAFNVYATLPGGGRTLAEGDGALGSLTSALRAAVIMALELATPDRAGHGQQWLGEFTTPSTDAHRLYEEFIWYDEARAAVDYAPAYGESWLARGARTLVWRDGWGADALWIAVRIGILNTAGAHNGLGAITVYRSGDLVADPAVAMGDATLDGDLDHSVLYVPPADPSDEGRLFWGAPEIEHCVSSPAYLYLAGDMTDAYVSQPVDRDNTVARKQREVLVVGGEGVVLVMDRAESLDPADDKIFQLYLGGDPVASGADHVLGTGGADLTIRTVYPEDVVAAVEDVGIPRLRVSTPDAAAAKSFLHLLRVTDHGADPGLLPVAVTGGEVAAAAFAAADGSAEGVVAFSLDPEGDPPAAESFVLAFDHAGGLVRVYLVDLEPGATYYADHALAGATLELTVSTTPLTSGTSHAASADGVVSFEFLVE